MKSALLFGPTMRDRQFTPHLAPRALRWSVSSLLVALAGAVATGACSSNDPFKLPLSGSGSGGSDTTSGSGGGAEATVNQGEVMFHALEEDFINECGACHKIAGSADTPFLGDPDAEGADTYQAVTSWPDAIVKTASNSVLLTRPAEASHGGGPTSADLAAQLLAWLEEEAKAVANVADDPVPTIPPFKPIMGFNAVYLDALGSEFIGMAVTFSANELTESTLSLTNIEVHPTTQNGLSISHPLFNYFATGSTEPQPDPIDSFSNVEMLIEAGDKGILGPGSVVLTNWGSGGKLSIAFEELATVPANDPGAGGGGGGPAGPCNALDSFIDNAQQAFENNCTACHGGGNMTATNAVNMTQLLNNPSVACGQILNRVDVADPNNSQIFETTDPSIANGHPYKFGSSQNQFNTFRTAVSTWITAESP